MRQVRKKILGYGLIIILLLGFLELSSYGVITLYARHLVPRFLIDANIELDAHEYERYLLRRDKELGWPPPDALGTAAYDWSGSRPVPNFPIPGGACISLYGDSFVYGSEVANELAWGNGLSGLVDCRVANYGVPGYGPDQALIRFRRFRDDEANLIVLGIHPVNIYRIVSQFHGFVSGRYDRYDFKPRFILDEDGALRMIPIPTLESENVVGFPRNAESTLTHEYFLPGTKNGPIRMEFPYVVVVARLAMNEIIHSRLSGRPSYASLFSPEHQSGALTLMVAITERFVDEAESRGKTALVVVFPSKGAMRYFDSDEMWGYEPLLDALQARGISVLNIGPSVHDYLNGRDFCELVVAEGDCYRHLNAEGNAVVATVVRDWIAEADLLPTGGSM